MKISEAYAKIHTFINDNKSLFEGITAVLEFGEDRPIIADWSNSENMGMLVAGDGIGSKSGLYFYTSLDGDILYIGKATKNNLHQRVWDHVKTPEALTDDLQRRYPNHVFRQCEQSYIDAFQEGAVKLAVVTVSEPVVVSLLEVYLQTLYVKTHEKLPVLNKQIG